MRPALQRLLGSPSALRILRNAIDSSEFSQSCWSCNTNQSKNTIREYSSRNEGPSIQKTEQMWKANIVSKRFAPYRQEGSTNAAGSRLGRTDRENGRKRPTKSIRGAAGESKLSEVQERNGKARKSADQREVITPEPKPASKPASISLERTPGDLTDAHPTQETSPRKASLVNKRSRKPDSPKAPGIKRSFTVDELWRDPVDSEPQLSLALLEQLCLEKNAVFFDLGGFHTEVLEDNTISCDSWCNFVDFEHQSSHILLESLYYEEKANGHLDRNRFVRAFLINNDNYPQLPSKKQPKKLNDLQTSLKSGRDHEQSVYEEIKLPKASLGSWETRCAVSEGNAQSVERKYRAIERKYRAMRERNRAPEEKLQGPEDKYRSKGRQRHREELSRIELQALTTAKKPLNGNPKLKNQNSKQNDGQRQSKTGQSSAGQQPSIRQLTRHPADSTIGTPNTKIDLGTKRAIPTLDRTAKRDLNEEQVEALIVFKKINTSDSLIRKHAVYVDDQSPPDNFCSTEDCSALTERSRMTWESESSVQNTDAESSLSWEDCISLLPAPASRVVDPKARTLKPMMRIDVSVSNTVQNSPPLGCLGDWRSKLMTSKQYEYESSVHLPASEGPRLLDHNQYGLDFELWLELILYRRRAHGVRGPKPLWELIQGRNVELPTEGSTAARLWTAIVQMGLVNPSVLPSVVQYAVDLQHKTNRYWRHLYITVMRYLIVHDSSHVHRRIFYYYHTKLYAGLSPTADQFLELFDLVYKRRRSSSINILKLQRIYADLPYRNLYSSVMTRLYKNENFEAAASWHNLMVTRKDVPSDLQTYRPIFRYMALYGNRKVLTIMVDKMIEAGVPLPSFINHPLPISPSSQELIDKRLAEVHSIKPSPISDEFCARMFATAFFSVETVIYLLRMAGAKSIGSLSIREIAVRENCVPSAVMSRIKQLKHSGIKLEKSTYCTLVSRLAVEENARLLENVVRCDLHPEAFDDRDLQESLLGVYHANGDQLQVDRTLAILMATCPEEHLTSAHWNVQLRLRLRQRDIPAVSRILEAMYASGIVVEPRSSSYVRRCLLTRRAIGKRPHYVYDLPVIINIWQNVLKSGGIVPAPAWTEILRRLGMTGQLEQYERLALWLAGYYSSAAGFTLGLLPRSQVITKEFTRRLINVPTRLGTRVSQHPLRVLFPSRVQQAIIAWGFQHARIGGTNWRWGLYLLLKLKRLGVYVGRETVAHACRQRLGILFGSREPSKPINRRLRAGNTASLEQYLREIEKVGGKSLLFGRAYPEDDEERIKLLLERFDTWDKSHGRLEGPRRILLVSFSDPRNR